MHISTKYGCQEIIDKLDRALDTCSSSSSSQPTNSLRERCAVALSSFGDSEQIRVDLSAAAAWRGVKGEGERGR